jgi:hypothetical protein
MSDGTFGQLVLPVPVPAARNDLPIPIAAKDVSLADPALDTLLSFIQAVLDYELTVAWAVRAPGSQVNKAARFTSTNDPTEGEFNEDHVTFDYGNTAADWRETLAGHGIYLRAPVATDGTY